MIKESRYKTVSLSSFAYTQTIIRLYANNRSPIRKRSFAYTQIEAHSGNLTFLLSDGVEVGEEGHLAAHGLAGSELSVYPEVALVEVGLLTGPAAIVPIGIAVA